MNLLFRYLLLITFAASAFGAPVPVKSYTVQLTRNVAPVAWEGFAGAPISITGTLPAGQDFGGLVSIKAELHSTQSNSATPLAVSDTLEELPTGSTVTLTFSSAKMNRATGKYFISIYATYADSRLEVFRVAEIRLAEGGSSQLTPPAPAPALYVTDADFDALELRVVDLEENGGGGGGGGSTNLTYTASPTNGIVVSSTGADATIPLGTGTNAGLLAPAQFTKLSNLSGINTGDQDLSSYATTAAVASGYQPLDSDLTAIAALTTTTYGRSLLALADAAAFRTAGGLGTLATQSATITDYLTTATAASTYVPTTRTVNGQALSGDVTITNISGNAATVTTNANLTGIVTSTGNATSIADGAIALAKLAVNPLARSNHTGTQAASTITGLPCEFQIAASDLTTAITAGTGKAYFRAPFGFTLTAVRASVLTAPTGSTILIDINESGTTVLSTKIMIDASEKTSTTAATAPVISDSAIADDAEITVDFDQVGATIAGAGIIVTLIGTR